MKRLINISDGENTNGSCIIAPYSDGIFVCKAIALNLTVQCPRFYVAQIIEKFMNKTQLITRTFQQFVVITPTDVCITSAGIDPI